MCHLGLLDIWQQDLLHRSARADLSYCLPGVPAQPAAQVEKEALVEWLFVQWADGNFGPGCKTPRIGHV